eukprot:358574-Chlamydomonas_euryale.AAC.1
MVCLDHNDLLQQVLPIEEVIRQEPCTAVDTNTAHVSHHVTDSKGAGRKGACAAQLPGQNIEYGTLLYGAAVHWAWHTTLWCSCTLGMAHYFMVQLYIGHGTLLYGAA